MPPNKLGTPHSDSSTCWGVSKTGLAIVASDYVIFRPHSDSSTCWGVSKTGLAIVASDYVIFRVQLAHQEAVVAEGGDVHAVGVAVQDLLSH
jgi:hypothetical protein